MSDTAPGSRAGTRFGNYRLIRLLGHGGMSEVYEAEDAVKERTVALKLLSVALSEDPAFRARLQREARAAGRLQEPHVVPIHDYGEIDGQLFVDMRLIDGPDLAAVLRNTGPMQPTRAVGVVQQAASALDAAHAVGVIHRDVKPENILLTGDDFVYLVDFGIASITSEQNPADDGQVAASWKYSAPELITGNHTDHRVDVYALACVLYECLTGRPPFPLDSVKELALAHLRAPIPRPSGLVPELPAAFDAVIAKGLAKSAADRYPSAGALARAAQDALTVVAAPASAATAAPIPRPTPPPRYLRQPGSGPAGNGPESWLVPAPPSRLDQALAIARRPVVIAAAVLTVGVVIGWLLLRPAPGASDSVASRPVTADLTTPAESVADAKARLLSLLPHGYPAGACNPVTPPPEALARASCSGNIDPGGPPSAIYTIYPDQTSLQAGLDALSGSERPVVCPGRIQSPGPWHRVSDPAKKAGTVLCTVSPDRSTVAWTTEADRLLAVTQTGPTGPTLDQLFSWWSSHS